MKKQLPFYLLLLWCVSGYGQGLLESRKSSVYTYIYQITEAEAQNIYEKGSRNPIHDGYFHTLIDSFPTDSSSHLKLLPGYYLQAYAQEHQLKFLFTAIPDFEVKIIDNNTDLCIQVYDSLGHSISDANVTLKNKRLKYDFKTESYLRRKSNKEGLLRVEHQGKTSYFHLDRKYSNSWFKRSSRKVIYGTPLRYAWVPIQYVVRMPVDGVKSIIKRRKVGVIYSAPYALKRGITKFGCWISNCHKWDNMQGYMIFSKPKYLPGDTVKLKAFVVDKKGRPYSKELKLRIRINSNSKLLTTLTPYRDGAYTYAFPVSDSLNLKLDRAYRMSLERKTGEAFLYGSFVYEDYELGKIKLTLDTDEEDQYRDIPFVLKLEGTDENELNLPDARAEVLLTTNSVNHYWADSVFIPDTLYFTEVQLEPDGETEVIIPDSLMPLADFSYTAKVTMRTSDNEQVEESQKVFFYDRRQFFDFEIQDDSVHIAFQENGIMQAKVAIIYEVDNFGNLQQIQQSELPCKVALNPYFAKLKVVADGVEGDLAISQELALLQCFSQRSRDSLSIVVDNPRKIPFTYFLYQKNKEILRGTSDSLQLFKKIHTRQKMFLSLHYLWGGKMVNKNYQIDYLDKALNVELVHPQLVYPGQSTSFKVLVTNQEGEAVPDVDLTVFGLTKKFNYSVPAIPYLGKKRKGKSVINNFKLKEVPLTGKSVLPLSYTRWRKLAGLDSMEYYHFLYPEKTLYQFPYPAPDSLTQFAPFVVSGGAIQPIQVIYVDSRPVYFAWSTNTSAYSFPISPGYHEVKLRLYTESMVIDSMYFPKGQKLVFSADLRKTHPQIKIMKEEKRKLSEYEQQLLYPYIFPYRYTFGEQFAYIEQLGQVQFLKPATNSGVNQFAGPVLKQKVSFHLLDSFSINFLQEPFFQYEFSPQVIKMREQKMYAGFTSTPRKDIGSTVIQLSDIQQRWKEYGEWKRYALAQYYNPRYTNSGYGSLWIEDAGKEKFPKPLNVVLRRYDMADFIRVYPGKEYHFHQLDSGYYQVIYFYPDAEYHIVDSLWVKKQGLNYYRLPRPDSLRKDAFSFKVSELIKSTIFKRPSGSESSEILQKIKNTYQQEFTYRGDGPIIEGYVRDKSGEPLIGANILVKGTSFGTVTDFDGHFSIKVPPYANELEASYTGFGTMTFEITGAYSQDVVLEDAFELNEVVVVAYRVPLIDQDNTTSVSIVSSETIRGLPTRGISSLQGSVAGISISDSDDISVRGSRADGTLYFIDGIRVSGEAAGISEKDIATIERLSGEEAQALYGPLAVNGVVLITTKKKAFGGAEYDAAFMEAAGSSRSIRENFSDAAFWQPQLKTDARGEAEFTITIPDDVTSWQTFALAINGKKQSGQTEGFIKSYKPLMALLATPRFLVQGDTTYLIGKVLNYTTDTLKVSTRFQINDSLIHSETRNCVNVILDTLMLTTTTADTVNVQYSLEKEAGYFDGEKRALPQFLQGMEATEGQFYVLDQDSILQLSFAEDLGEVTFYAQANVLEVLEAEIDRLIRYKYFCNEQLASKLKALLVQRSLYEFNGKTFEGDKQIQKILEQLDKNQSKYKLWGWWKDSGRNYWISLHVLEAIVAAQQKGYSTKWNNRQITEELVAVLEGPTADADKLRILYILQLMDARVDYRRYLEKIKLEEKTPLQYRLQVMELKQLCLSEFDRDSLQSFQRETMLRSIYFGEDEATINLHDNAIQNTLMAYRMLRRDSVAQEETLRKMRNYFLEKRQNGYWRNTYESARIIETIALDLMGAKGKITLPELQLSGAVNKTLKAFPIKLQLGASEQLTVHKTGDYPIYLTAYQHYWNPRPVAKTSDFGISTHFDPQDSTGILKAGEKVNLIVTLEVFKDADYLQIEVPIPAGCSYGAKNKSLYQEIHREYFKNETSIFCEKLNRGTYRFVIELIPRYAGKYSLNPAVVELMYFPTFNANTELKRVEIE